MSKGKQITLAIIFTFLASIIISLSVILLTTVAVGKCEFYKDVAKYKFLDATLLLSAFVIQMIVVFVLYLKATYKSPYILSLVIYFGILIAFSKEIYSGFSYSYPPFNKQNWFSEDKETRTFSAQGIIERKDLEDKSTQQIFDYLGEPESKSESVWSYNIGFGKMIVNIEGDYYQSAEIKCN